MKKVLEFLQLFLPVTLAKRVVAIILIAAGIPVPRITELCGLCDRSTRGLVKSLQEGDATGLLAIQLVKENNIDLVIGAGGASIMDYSECSCGSKEAEREPGGFRCPWCHPLWSRAFDFRALGAWQRRKLCV